MGLKDDFFNKAYYDQTISKYGYNNVEFKTVDFSLQEYDVASMQRRFLCHHNGNAFSEAVRAGKKAIVTTGFGMSGNPHLGTLSQIIKISDLNSHGMTTQVVLGDLDSYNARNQPLDKAWELRDKFSQYLDSVGYKEINNSVLRDQFSHPDVLQTAYLVSKYITDEDFEEAKEDIADVYEKAGIYKGWSFPMKQALTLMIADFVHLHLHHGYDHVMVMLGLEEHKYVRMANKVIERMGLELEVGGIYGRIIKGLSGYPKMSKSLKGSAIDISTPISEAKSLLKLEHQNSIDPRDNSAFLIMEQVSFFSNKEIEQIEKTYKTGSDKDWQSAIDYYIENQLTSILGKWPKLDNHHKPAVKFHKIIKL